MRAFEIVHFIVWFGNQESPYKLLINVDDECSQLYEQQLPSRPDVWYGLDEAKWALLTIIR